MYDISQILSDSVISEIYEVAVKKSPQNEELSTHLFMSYVRTSQYKKQQQVHVAYQWIGPHIVPAVNLSTSATVKITVLHIFRLVLGGDEFV